jgi:hypothetical protein
MTNQSWWRQVLACATGLVAGFGFFHEAAKAQQAAVDSMFVVDSNQLYSVSPTGAGGWHGSLYGRSIAAAGNSVVFVKLYSPVHADIVEIDMSPPATLLPLTVGYLPSHVLALTRDKVWAVTYDGQILFVRRGVPSQPYTLLGNASSIISNLRVVNRAATNGRDLFFSTSDGIYAVDLYRQPFSVRSISSALPSGWRVGDLAMGRNGKLLAVIDGGGVFSYVVSMDPDGGNVAFEVDAWYITPHRIGYNPWTDNLMLCNYWVWQRPMSQPWVQWHTIVWGINFSITDVKPNCEAPFELFGIGCPNSLGRDPRLSWTGLAKQGQAFSVDLRDAEPNGFAMMWLGWNDSFWAPVGPLPFDAAAYGAPGCNLLVAPDAPLPVFLDSQGRGSYTVQMPIAPALAGLEVYAQSVSSSNVNPLGFVTSDAMVIRMR